MLDALAEADVQAHVVKLAVREMPTSGTPEELLHGAGIDADAIADAASSWWRRPLRGNCEQSAADESRRTARDRSLSAQAECPALRRGASGNAPPARPTVT